MFINETHSTSTLLRQQYSDELPHLYAIRTDFQTAGRGQTGNGWESEKGKNLLVSVLLKYPEIAASEQWRLSMLVAVTLYEAIAQFVPEQMLTIKWPNDIYYGEKKMAGILLENFLQGPYIQYSIAGVGVNVNQTEWVSDAPNPLSMRLITGEEYDVETLMHAWMEQMVVWQEHTTQDLRNAYMQRLYRKDGWHYYVEREVDVSPTNIAKMDVDNAFLAQIVDITPQGELQLRMQNDEIKTYHFKQIRFVLSK